MSNYTKGPWTVNVMDYTNSIGIECEIDGIGHTIVTDQFCYPNFQKHGSDEKLANAKLIAASPTMFEYISKKAESGCEEAKKIISTLG